MTAEILEIAIAIIFVVLWSIILVRFMRRTYEELHRKDRFK